MAAEEFGKVIGVGNSDGLTNFRNRACRAQKKLARLFQLAIDYVVLGGYAHVVAKELEDVGPAAANHVS